MHPERTTGRFGVATNQTIKRNADIRINAKAVSHYTVHGEQAAFSLNRHKAWEMLDDAEESTMINSPHPNDDATTSQEKRQCKKKQFQEQLNKSKHDLKLQKKELSKLKKLMMEQEEKSDEIPSTIQNNSSMTSHNNDDQEEEEEPRIVKTLIGKSNRYAKKVTVPENGILISEVMNRDLIYKLKQHRDRDSHRAIPKSRHQRKEAFEKSIFL